VSTALADRRAAGDDGEVVLLFCDLDRFKPVNDTHGHDLGDRVLQIVAQRLAACVAGTDVVGRYGGDEFTVLLDHDVPPPAVTALVARLTARVGEPIVVDGVVADVGVTVGVSRQPVASADVDEMLRLADRAMYARKPGRSG
jgi:diguanylate cyclase (GGDEF)-like protein